MSTTPAEWRHRARQAKAKAIQLRLDAAQFDLFAANREQQLQRDLEEQKWDIRHNLRVTSTLEEEKLSQLQVSLDGGVYATAAHVKSAIVFTKGC